jgi:hypothetical protein
MISLSRNLNQGGAAQNFVADSPATGSWGERYLPPRGFERNAFVFLAGLLLAFKVLAIYHFRVDSDETQHAHVIWATVTGQLQYRDVFDNHMPLFQLLCRPLMAVLGERPDIMICLRWAMLPLTLLSLCAVYGTAQALYSRRIAPWAALLAGTLAKFFFTSTEFRPDQLWIAFWFLALLVMVTGEFTFRRAFLVGLLLGGSGAVSVKTVPLVCALAVAAAPAFALAYFRGQRLCAGRAVGRLAAMGVGMLILPAAMVLYFTCKGAFGSMYYGVIAHNLVPGMKRWGDIASNRWIFLESLPVLIAGAWIIFRQTPDTQLAIRRTIVLLAPWAYLFLLLSYWPDVTREDDLPYIPLVPLSFIPLALALAPLARSERWRRNCLTYGLPALVLFEFAVTYKLHGLRRDQMRATERDIADVLTLTSPSDYVMDNKGEYVYRRRAWYWMLETVTKERVRHHLLRDDLLDWLVKRDTKVCSLRCGRDGSPDLRFIRANYLPFDSESRDVGVLGKIIGRDSADGTYSFAITIPQSYVVISEWGRAAGEMDGKPCAGAVWLAAGKHEFHRSGGSGRIAVFLADAYGKGFLPNFDDADRLASPAEGASAGRNEPEAE